MDYIKCYIILSIGMSFFLFLFQIMDSVTRIINNRELILYKDVLLFLCFTPTYVFISILFFNFNYIENNNYEEYINDVLIKIEKKLNNAVRKGNE